MEHDPFHGLMVDRHQFLIGDMECRRAAHGAQTDLLPVIDGGKIHGIRSKDDSYTYFLAFRRPKNSKPSWVR